MRGVCAKRGPKTLVLNLSPKGGSSTINNVAVVLKDFVSRDGLVGPPVNLDLPKRLVGLKEVLRCHCPTSPPRL